MDAKASTDLVLADLVFGSGVGLIGFLGSETAGFFASADCKILTGITFGTLVSPFI